MRRYDIFATSDEKYPPWLASNKEKISANEYETYSNQYTYVQKIMTRFDDPNYDEEDKQTKVDLMDMLQKVNRSHP